MHIYSFLASSNGDAVIVVPFIMFAAIIVLLVRGVENQEQDQQTKIEENREHTRREAIKNFARGVSQLPRPKGLWLVMRGQAASCIQLAG